MLKLGSKLGGRIDDSAWLHTPLGVRRGLGRACGERVRDDLQQGAAVAAMTAAIGSSPPRCIECALIFALSDRSS